MKEEKISKASTPSRLFTGDESYLKRQVKDRGNTDNRFKDNSSAVRYYVHLGIITEKRTESVNTLNDRIIKATQKEVVVDSLLPLKNSIDDLTSVIKDFGEKQREHFIEARKENYSIVRQVESLNESNLQLLGNITQQLLITEKLSSEALRNSLVMRSLLYVFLLGIKTGRILPHEHTPWEKLVTFAHSKIQDLAEDELEKILSGNYESNIVENLASEMFSELAKLQKTFR